MRCEFCGNDNQPGVKFCSKCGAQFPEIPAESANAGSADVKSTVNSVVGMFKAMPLKKLLIIAIPVIVIIVAAIIFIPMLGGSSVDIRKDNISLFFDGDLIIISGNNNAKFTIDGSYESVQRSIDGSKAAILTDYRSSTGGTLWFVTTSGAQQVADDVMSYLLSDTGKGLVYMTDYDNKNYTAELYLYDTSSKKSTRITDEAFTYGYDMIGVCISPNGKSVSYVTDYDTRDEEFTGYLQVDGKTPEKLGTNTYALAVSDGGRHLYYLKGSSDGRSASLHVRSGRNENRLIPDVTSEPSLRLNKAYSQLIYNMDGRSYISQNGADRIRIGGTAIRGVILPRGAQVGGNSDIVTVYGIRSFANNVIRNEDGLAYMDSSYETNRISSTSDNASRAVVSDNGKTLLYVNNNGHLSAIDPTRQNAERREIGRDVLSFTATNDAKTIYFINDDNELYCAKGNGVPAKISDDVYTGYLVMPQGTSRVFFLVDYSSRRNSGELQFSNNGGKKTPIIGGDDVIRVWAPGMNAFYTTVDNDVFRSSGNEKFTLFAEDIRG